MMTLNAASVTPPPHRQPRPKVPCCSTARVIAGCVRGATRARCRAVCTGVIGAGINVLLPTPRILGCPLLVMPAVGRLAHGARQSCLHSTLRLACSGAACICSPVPRAWLWERPNPIGSSYAYATYEHASLACAAVHSAETFACRWLPLPGPGSATGFHVLQPVYVCFILLVKPRPTVPKYPGGIDAGGNGGSGGIVEQKSTTSQTGDYNSGKTYRLHLLLVLPSDGNRALRAWS